MTDDEPTEEKRSDEERTGERVRETLADVDHTHPHTDEPFGSSGVYDRGQEGEGDEDEEATAEDDESRTDDGIEPDGGRRRGRRTPRDRDHRPPEGRGVQPAYDRGSEVGGGR
jgi:hypothetical protein